MDAGAFDPRDLTAEVSGWDSNEDFFVEKTRMCWGREGSHEVVLHRNLRAGSVVFVRLLGQFADVVDFPTAYRVDRAEALKSSMETRILLIRLHPKASFRETAGLLAGESQYMA